MRFKYIRNVDVIRASVGGDMYGPCTDGYPTRLCCLTRLPSSLPGGDRSQLLPHRRRAVHGRRPPASPRLISDVVHGQ